MKIATIDFYPVSIPYRHAELSSRVSRGGVSDVVVRMTADDGRIGWGECCSGADTNSVLAAAKAMNPFLIGRSPSDGQTVRHDLYKKGLWDYRIQTANFAWAGLDMAMLDLLGQDVGLPIWRLLGGRGSLRPVSYFHYLTRDTNEGLARQCEGALIAGYEHFYLKVGIDATEDERMIAAVRQAIGHGKHLRIDANEAWSAPQAAYLINRWHDAYDLDFVEAPIRARPVRQMSRLRERMNTRLCANEGLGCETDVLEMITAEAADVLCFSSYWVGGLQQFLTLSRAAEVAGIKVCKHSHGEFGIAAAAHQHALLALGDGVCGHQHTAALLADDIVEEQIPIRTEPFWGEIEGAGLGIRIDGPKLDRYHKLFLDQGQFLPWAANE